MRQPIPAEIASSCIVSKEALRRDVVIQQNLCAILFTKPLLETVVIAVIMNNEDIAFGEFEAFPIDDQMITFRVGEARTDQRLKALLLQEPV